MPVSREERLRLIEAIERKRGSRVIVYVTSDRYGISFPINEWAVPLIHEHILGFPEADRGKLDLFLYSRGGSSDVPWALVSMFREYCQQGSFSVLIPYRAHSAATVISLGADEIVMTRKAELGPIDITMETGPYNPTEKDSLQRLPVSVEDVMGYFALLNKVDCGDPADRLKAFTSLAEYVHPLALGSVSRLHDQTKLVAFRLLSTRANPFGEEQNQEIVKRLSSEVYSHAHAISRTEALRYIGLEQVVPAERAGIADELWQLYKHYEGFFPLNEPFLPEEELIATDREEGSWENMPLACVESAHALHVRRQGLRIRRLRQVPPQVSITLQALGLPAINIPNLPRGVNAQDIMEMVTRIVESVVPNILNSAAQAAAEQMLKSMPQVGFERVLLSSRWERED